MTRKHTRRRLATALGAALLSCWALSARAELDTFAHTSTLLLNGDVLIIGGNSQAHGDIDGAGPCINNAAGGPTNRVQLVQTSRGGSIIDTRACMSVARASHTATNLPNGSVLVVGGLNAAGNAEATGEVYDPLTNTWSGPFAMNFGRFNHTATMLNNGKVLICGGQSALAAGPAVGRCELFDYNTNTFSAPLAITMLLPRYNHTATLLKDGRVWFAGGVDPSRLPGSNPAIETTERYVPAEGPPATANGFFQSAAPLIEGRAYHSATLMGDGKVLVTGGYNRFVTGGGLDRFNIEANRGILQTAEIFDPLANSVTPAAPMQTRRQQTATLVDASGSVFVMGGLGNITTTYFTPSSSLTDLPPGPAGALSMAYGGTPGQTTISAGTAYVPLDITLSKPVVGVISDGEVFFGGPTDPPRITLNSGTLTLTPGDVLTGTGLRASLNGMSVTCVAGVCGKLQSPALAFTGLAGTMVWDAETSTLVADFTGTDNTTGSGRGIRWLGGNLTAANNTRFLDANNVIYVNLEIELDDELSGTITNGVITVLGGSYTQGGFATINFSGGGTASIPAGTPIVTLPSGQQGIQLLNHPVTIYSGTIGWNGEDPAIDIFASPHTLPAAGPAPVMSLDVSITLTASDVDVTGKPFAVNTASAVVRSMVFGDADIYNPKTNSWSFNSGGGAGQRPAWTEAHQRFGGTATLLPNDDVLYAGGRECVGAACAPAYSRKTDLITNLYTWEKNFSGTAALQQPRAFHTGTLLPSGKILVAGGTDGGVLQSGELYDPAANTMAPVANLMSVPRDLHTATLLPTGRVLLAGGFSTTATSTGSTKKVDLYYPEANVFLPAEPMISSRSNHTATQLPDGRLFVAGGFGDDDVISDTAEIYDPVTGKWTATANMPANCARAIHAAVLRKDGKVMLIGGTSPSGILATSAVFDPVSGLWNQEPVNCPAGGCACSANAYDAMPSQLRSHTATLLKDGHILVVGGNDGFGEANVAYIYDPNDGPGGSWISPVASPLYEARFNHTANLLPNGDVMVTGGAQRFGNVPQSIEVWHQNAGVFISGGAGGLSFSASRRAYHSMTLANNNKMVALGGSDGNVGSAGVTLPAAGEAGYFTVTADQYSKNFPPSFRQSTIFSASNTLATPTVMLSPGGQLRIQGLQFRGGTEASGGGAASGNSDFNVQRLVLQQVHGSGGAGSQSDAGFIVDLSTEIYKTAGNANSLNTDIRVNLPATQSGLPVGWYMLRQGANDIYSEGRLMQVGPERPAAVAGGSIVGTIDPADPTSGIDWTWGAVAGASGYSVYSATTGVLISTRHTNSFAMRGLAPSATASILVAAFTLSGDGPLTASPTTYTRANPPILGPLALSGVTANSVRVDWGFNGNSVPGTYYELSMSTDADPVPGAFSQSCSTPMPASLGITTNNFTVSGLDSDTLYYFRVRAFNPSGIPTDITNHFQNSVAVGGFSAVRGARTTSIVTGLTGTPLSTGTIRWAWNSVATATSYKVYNATTGVLLTQINAPAAQWVDGNDPTDFPAAELDLGTNTARSVRVLAVTPGGDGPLSASVTAYTLAQAPQALVPSVPVLSITTGSFNLVWSAPANPPGTQYRVTYNQLSPLGVALSTISISTGAQMIALAGLDPATPYQARVVSLNQQGVASAVLQLGTTYTLPLTPTNFQLVDTTSSTISLSWSSANGPSTRFRVQYTTSTPPFTTDVRTAIDFLNAHTVTTYTIVSLAVTSTYAVRVEAMTPFGTASQPTLPLYTTDYVALVPGNVNVLDSEPTWALVSWTANGNRPVTTRYRVQYSTSSPPFVADTRTAVDFAGLHNVTSYTVTGLLPGATYAFRVSAANPFGTPSADSLTFHTTNYIAAPPATIAVTDSSLSTLSLSWGLSGNRPNTTRYQITISSDNFTQSVSTPLAYSAEHTVTTYTIVGLSSSSVYWIRIGAKNPFATESPVVAPFATEDTITPTPSNLRVLGVDPFTITLAWDLGGNDPVYGRYQVTYSTDNFTTPWSTAVFFSQGLTATTATISGLITGQQYWIRVAAQRPFFSPSPVTVAVATRTFNGGAPQGSIAALALYNQNSRVFGSLGNGRNVEMRIPARSFPTDVTITISSRDIPGVLCPGGANIGFEITDNPALQPIGPIYLSFELTPGELAGLPAGRSLLMRYDPGSGTCVPLETTLVGNLMTARLNHFSVFQVAAAPLFSATNEARIFPNPYYAGRDGFVTFDRLPPDARVRVFTLRGEEVLDAKANGAGLLTWSGTNTFGRSIASGLYIVRVESGGSSKLLKLAVIR